MKTIFRYAFGTVTVLLLVLVVAGVVFFLRLPSAREVSSRIKPPVEKTSESRAVSPERQSPKPDAQVAKEDSSVKKIESENTSHLIDEQIFNPEKSIANVCDHLMEAHRSPVTAEKKSVEEFFRDIQQALNENQEDPIANTVFAPLRYAVRLPLAKSFLEEVQATEAKENETLMKKAGFYAKGLAAYNEIRAHSQQINDVSNYAYYLFLLGQAVRLNPQIGQNPDAMRYCQSIQDQILAGTRFDSKRSSEEMLHFLEFAHVRPEDIQFDPEFQSRVQIEFDAHQLSIGLGWIGKYMGLPEEAVNR